MIINDRNISIIIATDVNITFFTLIILLLQSLSLTILLMAKQMNKFSNLCFLQHKTLQTLIYSYNDITMSYAKFT